MTLAATLRIALNAVESSPTDLSPKAQAPIDLMMTQAFTDGTGNGQASKIFSDTRTVAASGADNLDLAGVLSSAFGVTIAFATVKAIIIQARAANAANIEFFGGVANAMSGVLKDASDVLVLRPGGAFVWSAPQAGVAVTAGTADILKVQNAGASDVTYDIVIIGT